MVSQNEDPKPPKKTKVKSGDTLSGIARDNGVTLNSILRANPQIKDPNKIRVGQNVNVPVGRESKGRVYKGWDVKHFGTGETVGKSVRKGINPYKTLPSQLPAIARDRKK